MTEVPGTLLEFEPSYLVTFVAPGGETLTFGNEGVLYTEHPPERGDILHLEEHGHASYWRVVDRLWTRPAGQIEMELLVEPTEWPPPRP